MAEVTGLVVGTITLVSLYSTCVQLFDTIEDGRHYRRGYQLAEIKFSLLQSRLTRWGDRLHIAVPGHEHTALRQHWGEEEETVGKALSGIQKILTHTATLIDRYDKTITNQSSLPDLLSSSRGALPSAGAVPTTISASKWSILKKRTSWAIRDKNKFERLIQDLSFLVTNLEKVCDRMENSLGKGANQGKPVARQETRKRSLNLSGSAQDQGPTVTMQNQQSNKDNVVGFQGSTGVKPQTKTVMRNDQTNADKVTALQGLLSADDLAKIEKEKRASGESSKQKG